MAFGRKNSKKEETAAKTPAKKADKKAAPKEREAGALGSTRSAKNVIMVGKTTAMKVSECYKWIFEQNEIAASGKATERKAPFNGRKTPLTDEQIAEFLKSEFGERGNNNHLVVSRNRKAFNNGTYPKLKEGEAARNSKRYDADGNVVEGRKRQAKPEDGKAAKKTTGSKKAPAKKTGLGKKKS